MRLHNKLEITKNGKTQVFYNKLVKNVTNSIQKLEPYFNFLAFGSGTSETTDSTTGLENKIIALPLTLGSFNIDTRYGDLYVSKSVDVNSTESFSFSEVGVAVSADTTETINRFVLDTPMTYTAGDSLSVTVTIYLAFEEATDGSLGFMAGENYLLGLFLGTNFNGIESHVFTSCTGINRASSSATLIYDRMPNTEFETQIVASETESGASVTFTSTITTPYGASETIVGMDGVPVFRYSNYDYPNATLTTETYTDTVDNGMEVRLPVGYVKSIDSVLDTTTSTIVIDTVTRTYGTEYGEVNYAPFGEFNYTKDTPRCVSPDGKAIIFEVDGRFDYYILEFGVLKKMDASAFDNENLQRYKIFNDIIIARYYDEAQDRHYTRYYYLKDGKLVEGTISIPWGEAESELWNSLSLNICNAENSYIIGFITASDTYMGYLVRDVDAGSITGTLYYTIGKALDCFYVTGGSILEDGYGAGYLASDSDLGLYVFRPTGITYFTKSGAVNMMSKYGCNVMSYNGAFYGTYNEKVLTTNPRSLCYCDSLNYSMEGLFPADMYMVHWSVDGRYLFEVDPDGVIIRHYAFSRRHIKFGEMITSDIIPIETIEEVLGLSNLIIIFRSDGPAIGIPIGENHTAVSPMTVGDKVEVTYTTINLIGSEGDINMQATCNFSI